MRQQSYQGAARKGDDHIAGAYRRGGHRPEQRFALVEEDLRPVGGRHVSVGQAGGGHPANDGMGRADLRGQENSGSWAALRPAYTTRLCQFVSRVH